MCDSRNLPRELEINRISSFLDTFLLSCRELSIYLSGIPVMLLAKPPTSILNLMIEWYERKHSQG